MALTPEQIQEQLEAYFDSDEGKSYLDGITASISDEYTESEGGGYVSYGNISLEDWQEQNIVTDGNNNTSLSNDQLTQLKTFAAMQPKYDPIKVGVGMGTEAGATGPSDADRIRSEELRKTPGPIYTNFAAYSKALQDHNKKIKTYIEDNKIPTSITTPDGTKLELNVGLTPVYYQEQRDGGRLQNVLHMNTDQGYYTQLGGIGQYGSYHRPKISQSKSFLEGLKDQAPYFAAFIGVAILGPMVAQYIGSTGMGQFLSTASSKIITAVKNAPATFASIFGKEGAINTTFQNLLVSAGADAKLAEKVTLELLGSIAATTKGISYAEQYLDEESRAALEAAAASATGASGLPGGGTYSGPGAGPNGEVNPNVIYNLTTGTTAGATGDEDDADASGDALDAVTVIDALVGDDDDGDEDVNSAITGAVNAGGSDDEVVAAAGSAAAANVPSVDEDAAVVAATNATETATTNAAKATQTYSDFLAGIGMEDLDRTIAANEAQLRRIPRIYRKTRGKFFQRRIDQAKIEKRNRLTKAKQIADAARVDLENAKKAEALARKDAEDTYKSNVAQARRDAEKAVRAAIATSRANAKAAAEARAAEEAAAEEAGVSEARDGYSDVAGSAGTYSYDSPTGGPPTSEPATGDEPTTGGTDADTTDEGTTDEDTTDTTAGGLPTSEPPTGDEPTEDELTAAAIAANPQEDVDTTVTSDVTGGEPDTTVTPKVDPNFPTQPDPTDTTDETDKTDTTDETDKTDTTDAGGGGGGGGGGAGSGAGAGQGGDTGADAAVGTTSGETGEEGTTDTGSSGVPKEERWSYLGNNRWIRVKDIPVYLGSGLGIVVKPNWPDLEPGIYTVTPKDVPPTGSGDRVDDLSVVDSEEINTSTTTTTQQEDDLFKDILTAISTATTSTGTAGAADTTDTTTGGAGTDDGLGTGDTASDQDKTGAGTGGTGTGTTGPTDEVGGGDAGATGSGSGDADVTGGGAGASGTPGAGAGDTGEPGGTGSGTGVGSGTGGGTGTGTGGGAGAGTGTGTGTGTGSGTGGGDGSGTGTGTGAGTGSGTGSGEGEGEGEGKERSRGMGLGSQQIMQLLQPRRVQVEAAPLAEIERIYDISGRYVPIEKYRSPFGLPALGEPPKQRRPMGFKQGGLVSENTDNIFDRKEVGTVNDLLRILRDKR
tara:strand:+ start:565 stop:4065 length:3501 start_codon:yes stop_codon:yes gene_type:complete